MTRNRFLSVVAVGAALFAAPVAPALSQDAPPTDPTVTTDTTSSSLHEFADRDLLVETMNSLDDDADAGALDNAVADLSDDQVEDLNRSFNNLNNNVFTAPSEFDFDESLFSAISFLERITVDFNKQQITALTKALEEKIKFLYLAEKTGNDRFLEKADSQEQKFLSKVDKFAGETETTETTDVTAETVRAVKLMSKGAAKQAAKGTAKQAAKGAAKQAAKSAAKQAAKNAAKNAVKQSIKSQARNAAKGKKS